MSQTPYSVEISQNITQGLRWSEHFTFGFVLEGAVRLRIGNRVREYLAHDMLFFLPFETWSVVHASPDVTIFSLRIHDTFLAENCPELSRVSLQRHHLTADLTNETYCALCEQLAEFLFHDLKKELTSRLKMLSALGEFLTILIEAYGIVGAGNDQKNYQTERSVAVLSYLNEHYTEKVAVTDVADAVGLHPQYFSTWFKSQFGVGFVDYLTGFRVNHSIPDLLRSDKGILDIALDHGFSNHKTYAAAFHKVYGCSPRAYRKREDEENRALTSAERAVIEEETSGVFSWFRQFIKTDRAENRPMLQQAGKTLAFDPEKLKRQAFHSSRVTCLSAGRAYACLRSNLQDQIREAKRDMNLATLRVRDIFSDALYVYFEDEAKRPVFNWQTLDSVFDFLLSLEIRPFPEIGYMPERLAAKKQYAGYQYRPNVSKPKSMKLWRTLIESFLTHYLERYGAEELHKWDFDFWISPDLDIKLPYWYGTREEFFDFYRETWEVFHEVDPALRLGSANFSTISGYPWYEGFFAYCKKHKITPAFLSIHLYGSERRGEENTKDTLETIDYRNFSVSNPAFFGDQIEKLREIAERYGFFGLPLTVSDWNLSFLPRDYVRETCYIGPWICYNYVRTLGLAEKLSFWALSDIHEESFPESTLFYGGPGALDFHGLKKAPYNTLALLSKIGDHIYARGDYYLFAKKNETYQVLLFHLIEFDEMYAMIDNTVIDRTHRYNIYRNAGSLAVSLSLTLPAGTYLIKKWEVNRTAGSAYDIWAQIGFPETLHKDVEEYIEKSSVPRLTCEVQEVKETLLLDVPIPAHGVVLLEIENA